MDPQHTTTKAEEQMVVLKINPSPAKDPVVSQLASINKARIQVKKESSGVHIASVSTTTSAADGSDTADGMSAESEDELPSFSDIFSRPLQ